MGDSAKKQTRGREPRSIVERGLTTRGGLTVVRPGTKLELEKIDPDGKAANSKEEAAKHIEKLRARLSELQETLYAEHARSLLIVIQAMDTGGKDGAVKNLCHGIDPNGLHLTNFKAPTRLEYDHDFLWRVHHAAPGQGMLGIWNRSHYEDVLVPRVHKQISDATWAERCEDINAFERLLMRNGTTFLKFFLHISKEEQKERLEARLQDPQKLWKFNTGDLKERALWSRYHDAYEAVMRRTATKNAPWFIVAANHKWSRNLVMLETTVAMLERMKPKYPTVDFDPKSVVVK
jgi:PPK2 family polyphosphate:nucleotide phosphotransferase